MSVICLVLLLCSYSHHQHDHQQLPPKIGHKTQVFSPTFSYLDLLECETNTGYEDKTVHEEAKPEPKSSAHRGGYHKNVTVPGGVLFFFSIVGVGFFSSQIVGVGKNRC